MYFLVNMSLGGVSLHEMVSMGKPVLVSENVGVLVIALSKMMLTALFFLTKKNNDFKSKMKQLMKLSKQDLQKMGEESLNLSKSISTSSWVKTLNKIYD